ncbi:DUF4349 domain-containing protein [Croceicoccus gelatinilyticus]|uniref:DUF4349 domain-containing protein n=1 Tax=Croceicoccus gelatinilyticus TaxID=2835536 RepID=UPI001BCF81AB|nr:DUF4349 domain-containing protein [Croceicoccus gelatinilyticus]MBS7671293.1 DUF4349 domain-containing protein [Croceicoccus gelatinilyticus]
MRQVAFALPFLALAIASCDNGQNAVYEATESVAALDVADEAAAEAPPSASAGGEIAVALPKIAYVYSYGFRLPAEKIAPIQLAHADLCDAQGPQTCRILDMRQSGMEGEYSSGSLTLAVTAPQARAFGAKLSQLAGKEGGTQVSSAISGEDLSKQIVDTEARIKARTVLRDRLLEVLQTRRGTVAELVEAERAVARVNEEIDQAQSWLAEMRGRVDYSRVNISYESGMPETGSFASPVREAISSVSGILGSMLAAAIILLTILIPLGLVGLGIWRLVQRFRPAPKAASQTASEATKTD